MIGLYGMVIECLSALDYEADEKYGHLLAEKVYFFSR